VRLRRLREDDIPFAMRLKESVGWNQTEDDWRSLIALRPEGCFLAEHEGQPAGTVTTTAYGTELGWIGMLLVSAELRGRGIGRRLLDAAIESLAGCETVQLDATAAGRRLYVQIGFVDEAPVERWVRPASTACVDSPGRSMRIDPIVGADLGAIESFDGGAFGCTRSRVLAVWRQNAPEYAFVAKCHDAIAGYCLGRRGSRCDQIGPLVAVDEPTAAALVNRALTAAPGKSVLLDVAGRDAGWRQALGRLGFAVERELTRMRRGPERPRVNIQSYVAIAGLEVG
jgi:GNAT superfamily N-acetyltransferase